MASASNSWRAVWEWIALRSRDGKMVRRPSKLAELALEGVAEARDARAWQQLGGAALNELWDNPEDAVYDAWREIHTGR